MPPATPVARSASTGPRGVLASGGQDGGVALVGDGRGGAAAREPLLEAGGGWVERVAWSQASGCSQ